MEELKTTSDVIIIFDFQRDYSKVDIKSCFMTIHLSQKRKYK